MLVCFTLGWIPSAKRLLASFDRYRAREKKPLPTVEESARRWITEVFEHTINQIPEDLRGRVEAAQMFHEILEHRWYLGEKAGRDVGMDFSTQDYIAHILPFRSASGGTVSENEDLLDSELV